MRGGGGKCQVRVVGERHDAGGRRSVKEGGGEGSTSFVQMMRIL